MKRAVLVLLLAGCSSKRAAPAPWLADEATGFQRARDAHKAVLIDFTATWSVPSVEISQRLDALRPDIDRDFVAVRIDVSNENDARTDDVRERYKVPVLPAVVFVDTDGTVLGRIIDARAEPALRAAIADAAKRRTR